MKKLERPPIWIVMSLNQNREAFIHAVCTDEERAELYKEGIERDPMLKNPLSVWIEESEANHLWMWNLTQESRPINARDYLPMQDRIAQLEEENQRLMDCKATVEAIAETIYQFNLRRLKEDALKEGG